MSVRLIRTSPIEAASMLLVDGRPVQQRHSALMRILAAHGLTDRFVLAEPIVTFPTEMRPGQIAWYLDSAQVPIPVDLLPPHPARQARLHLEQLLPMLLLAASSDSTKLLHRALVLASTSGILWMDGTIVVVDWGLLPEEGGELLPPLELTALFADLASQNPASISVPSPFAKECPADPVEASPVERHHHRAADALLTVPIHFGLRASRPLLLHLVIGLLFLLLGLVTGLCLLGVSTSGALGLWQHTGIGSGA